MTEQPRRVIPPAASSSGQAPTSATRSRPSPAKDFPPLALIFMGFVLAVVGGVLILLDPLALKALGVGLAMLGQICILVGVIAQGVYIGTAKARDRGLL